MKTGETKTIPAFAILCGKNHDEVLCIASGEDAEAAREFAVWKASRILGKSQEVVHFRINAGEYLFCPCTLVAMMEPEVQEEGTR